MIEKAELSLLLDYYGAFLTEKQADILRMSADEDMSLAEIAEVVGVSRQGVRDSIVKAASKLEGFEERLGLIERDRILRSLISKLGEELDKDEKERARKTLSDIRTVIK